VDFFEFVKKSKKTFGNTKFFSYLCNVERLIKTQIALWCNWQHASL
jgi:hypothetical protein